MNYKWLIIGDGKHCHIYERYSDSDATMTHQCSGHFFGCIIADDPRIFMPVSGQSIITRITIHNQPNATAAFGFGSTVHHINDGWHKQQGRHDQELYQSA